MPPSQDLYSIWHIRNSTNMTIYHPLILHPALSVMYSTQLSAGCFVSVMEMVIVLDVICCEVYNPLCVLSHYLCLLLAHSLWAATNIKILQQKMTDSVFSKAEVISIFLI